jgi:hypothetical protein
MNMNATGQPGNRATGQPGNLDKVGKLSRFTLTLITMCGLLFSGTGCKEAGILPESKVPAAFTLGQASKIDGRKIGHIDGRVANSKLQYVEFLLSETVAGALKTDYVQRKIAQSDAVLLSESVTGTSADEQVASSHFRYCEGETCEDRVLTLGYSLKNQAFKTLNTTATWIVPDPDEFYVEDDGEGYEKWPVTVTAYKASDFSQTLKIEFDRNGLTSKNTVSYDQLLFVRSLPLVEEVQDDMAAKQRASDQTKAQYHLAVVKMSISSSEDSDGAELQLYWENNLDYNLDFSKYHKGRFDQVYYFLHSIFGTGYSTGAIGSDNQPYLPADVNNANVVYDMSQVQKGGLFIDPSNPTKLAWFFPPEYKEYGFPLMQLTLGETIKRRLIAADDDQDYGSFSQWRKGWWTGDLFTYDLDLNVWQLILHRMNADSKQNGSGDDPINYSGLKSLHSGNFDYGERHVMQNGILRWHLARVLR